MRQKHWSGGFSMHDDGEVDVRGTYCALSVATLCNIATLELLEGVLAFLHSCQSYEGGIAGTPNSEAHGKKNFFFFQTIYPLCRCLFFLWIICISSCQTMLSTVEQNGSI